jgi:hypothetical protein
MSRTEALPERWMPPVDAWAIRGLPVLIQVPRPLSLPHPVHRSRSVHYRPAGPRRSVLTGRRLRREVRAAAYVSLALLPLTLALYAWPRASSLHRLGAHLLSIPSGTRQLPPVGGEAGDERAHSAISPVLLSVEPCAASGDSESETSVVFPGYLLPDDAREEAAHEGS